MSKDSPAHKRMMRTLASEWRDLEKTLSAKEENDAPLQGKIYQDLKDKSQEVLNFQQGDLNDYFTSEEIRMMKEMTEDDDSSGKFGPFTLR